MGALKYEHMKKALRYGITSSLAVCIATGYFAF